MKKPHDGSSMIVHLIAVTSAKEKILILTQLTAKHFQEKEPLLIIVPDEKALAYVDELLWKEPPDSFVPHFSSHIPCSSLITITTVKENLNGAKHALNLALDPFFCDGLTTLYEFDEQTSGPRRAALEARYVAYRTKGFTLSQLNPTNL